MDKLKTAVSAADAEFMRQALRLARRAYGLTSPNPLVGAVLVKGGQIVGQGWHHRAGQPHAEIEALRDAQRRGNKPKGATLYVTLEPCCTHGRTPPCTEAIIAAGIRRVVVAATDPNPAHAGRGFEILKQAGIKVTAGVLAEESARMNEAFNHWIVHRTPLVIVKTAMTLDGKLATATGQSKWITGEKARACAMHLRLGADAIVVGINTILADDPMLTVRLRKATAAGKVFRRIVLDSYARTPLNSKVASDEFASMTTVVVSPDAPKARVRALSRQVRVVAGTELKGRIDLRWLLRKLGEENVTSLLVEGGGEVNASFLMDGLAQRVCFFYAPKVLGGHAARRVVGGEGAGAWHEVLRLDEAEWKQFGEDLMLSARVAGWGK